MDVDFVILLFRDDLLSGEVGLYVVDEVFLVCVFLNKFCGKLNVIFFIVFLGCI